jgi:catechol 2,3-dioxygenase-like lactoylglutathione lyase family enzyme
MMARVIRTQGLTHIHLVVSDLDRALRFYEEAFGLQEQFRDGPTMVFLATARGDSITLNEQRGDPRAGARGGIEHFGFRRADGQDLDDAIAQIEHAGGRLVERGEHAPGVQFAYVADPDGYLIEL